MVKVTFTFDEQTVETLRRAAARSKKPQSAVVREAIQDYAKRAEMMNDEERRHMLKVFDRVVGLIPPQSQSAADAEISEIRAVRKGGGRRTRLR
jgi:metal-responsive CopG/Arc/MetJ family transcriptional regulator